MGISNLNIYVVTIVFLILFLIWYNYKDEKMNTHASHKYLLTINWAHNNKNNNDILSVSPLYNSNLLFLGGKQGNNDKLLKWHRSEKKMVNIIQGTGLNDSIETYAALSIDLDNDNYSDLIVARQNGVHLYKNNKDGTFNKYLITKRENMVPINLTLSNINVNSVPDVRIAQYIKNTSMTPVKKQQSISMDKYGHFNKDTHNKVTNNNSLLPIVDIQKDGMVYDEHILLDNNGTFKWIGYGNDQSSFRWGPVLMDLKLDSHLDLLVNVPSQNISSLESKRLIYNPDTEKYEKKRKDKKVDMKAMTLDIDGDGIQDIVWLNISSPVQINKTMGDTNNYINVQLPDSLEFDNAKVYVDAGKTFVRQYDIGRNLDQSIQFNLGKINKVDKIRVKLEAVEQELEFNNPLVNSTLLVSLKN